jgi:hypothetical protein
VYAWWTTLGSARVEPGDAAAGGYALRLSEAEIGRYRFMAELAHTIQPLPPGLRPPAWAARDAMRAAGIVSDEDLARWERGMLALDAAPARPTLFAPSFVAIGRRR